MPAAGSPGRSSPQYLAGGVFIPGHLSYVVILAMRNLQASAPRIRDDARLVLAAAENAAVHHHQARNLTAAAAQSFAAETPPLLSPAQQMSSSEPKITVADAAGVLDMTKQGIRRLAKLNRITGRKIARDVWELDRASVIAYGEQRRRGRGDGSGEASRQREGTDGGHGSRGGPAAA